MTTPGDPPVRYVVEVRGWIPDRTLPSELMERGRLHLYSVLQVSIRDDAALHGLLHRIQGLALTLVEFHRSDPDDPADRADASSVSDAFDRRPVGAELVVEGGLGELALDALRDVCVPRSVDTRLVVSDARVAGDVLTRLTAHGIDVLEVTGCRSKRQQ